MANKFTAKFVACATKYYSSNCFSKEKGMSMHKYFSIFNNDLNFSLYIFYCHKLQQWGWVTSSHNISYDPPPTYTDQSKHVNMAKKHIFNYTK